MESIDATIKHDGNPPFVWVAEIRHDFVDGCHVFTSKKIPGLLIVSQSAETAIKQLPVVIGDLVKLNLGFECEVSLGTQEMTKNNNDQPDFAVITKKAA